MDSGLSTTSVNPVQNKVITKAIEEAARQDGYYPTLGAGTAEKKKKDESRRTRNVTINFHVTGDEKSLIEQRIALSGLSKSDFFIQSTMNQKIVVFGNIRVYDQMRRDMRQILEEIAALQGSGCLKPETEMKLQTLSEMLLGWETDLKKQEKKLTE